MRARRLLVKTFALLLLIRVALWVVPFRIVDRAVTRLTRRAGRRERYSIEQIVWAVGAASRRIPAATCLTQALAGTLLLAANGHPSTLRLGVARNDDGRLRAHAWIESEGRTILGDTGEELFVAMR